jgi:hypothetical protein
MFEIGQAVVALEIFQQQEVLSNLTHPGYKNENKILYYSGNSHVTRS